MIAHCVLLTQPFSVTSIVGNPFDNIGTNYAQEKNKKETTKLAVLPEPSLFVKVIVSTPLCPL